MLDIKSKLVLKILIKECPNGSYKIVESKDIISSMPNKYRVDGDGLENILIHLERQEYISIKYDDDGVYCLCVLPYGNEVLEKEEYKKREETSPSQFWILLIIIFFSSMLSSVIGTVIAHLLLNN